MVDAINTEIINGTVKSFYVRTLVSYNSEHDHSLPKKGLNYEIGEILHVKNASDINWWRATKLNPLKMDFDSNDEGLIPSPERLMKKYTNKGNIVNFEEKTVVIDTHGQQTFYKINMGFVKGPGSIDMTRKRQHTCIQGFNLKPEAIVRLSDFYEIVETHNVALPRPLVVVGPGRSTVYDKLLEQHPDTFASPVNHTTRPKRTSEVEGIDYHFIEDKDEFIRNREAGLFVETVEYSGNYYGTSLLSVRNVMESKRHCIIDATADVIRNLEKNGIFPISILVCPNSYSVAKELMGGCANEKLVKSTLQYSTMLNSRDRLLFSARSRCAGLSELISDTYSTVKKCQKWGVWKRAENQAKLSYEIS